ncbi:hypothetical protein H0H81_012693 [Sphagnurus paluster]|uniref:F-box domain-containing protein n=1 Tax=Sphagnurus paluster TaxID=117069 RepID=A0A9P7GIF9_9AGAR|nr:hypothetical protein H0H81_012693 [Sphagnurus paluster]
MHVLSFLDVFDIINASQVNSSLHRFIQCSNVLQYHIRLQLACAQDNPNSILPISERLSLLKTHEEAWSHLTFDFLRVIPVELQTSHISRLTGGIYLFGDKNRRALHYINLPSKRSDTVEWNKIEIDKELIGVGLNILEHDLIAVLTSAPSLTEAQSYILEVQLLQLSTAKPHPQALTHVLFVAESSSTEYPSTALEVVGVNIVLIAIHSGSSSQPHDYLRVFDWMSGEMKLEQQIDLQKCMYHPSLVFLTAELLLIPNARDLALDIWEIPSSGSEDTHPLVPIVSLALPSISHVHRVSRFFCHAEPNPTAPLPARSPPPSSVGPDPASGSMQLGLATAYAKKPFHPCPEDAVVVINMHLQTASHVLIAKKGLFVRRVDLLEAVRRASAGDFVGHKDKEEGEGSGQAGGQDETVGAGGEAGPGHPIVRFSLWGSHIARCLSYMRRRSPWTTTSAGTRCLFEQSHDVWRVFDFNPVAVRRARAELAQRREGDQPYFRQLGSKARSTAGLDYVSIIVDPHGAVAAAGIEWDFYNMMTDEERVIGVKVGVSSLAPFACD